MDASAHILPRTRRDVRPGERAVLGALGLRAGAGHARDGLIAAVRQGLPATSFLRVVHRAGVSRDEAIRALRVARASLFRKLAARRRLSPDESQKVVRLARAILLAEYVLEDARRGQAWLREPVPALGGELPIDLLDTEEGARTVEETLLRLEYGILA